MSTSARAEECIGARRCNQGGREGGGCCGGDGGDYCEIAGDGVDYSVTSLQSRVSPSKLRIYPCSDLTSVTIARYRTTNSEHKYAHDCLCTYIATLRSSAWLLLSQTTKPLSVCWTRKRGLNSNDSGQKKTHNYRMHNIAMSGSCYLSLTFYQRGIRVSLNSVASSSWQRFTLKVYYPHPSMHWLDPHLLQLCRQHWGRILTA